MTPKGRAQLVRLIDPIGLIPAAAAFFAATEATAGGYLWQCVNAGSRSSACPD